MPKPLAIMAQEKSFVVLAFLVCMQTWLLSPLSRSSAVAAPSPVESYAVEMAEVPREVDTRQTYQHGNSVDGGVSQNGLERDIRAPRLRFLKRKGEQSALTGEPESSVFDEADYVIERDTRAPRLRFLKRKGEPESSVFDEADYVIERDIRAPRLRFIKRKGEQSGLSGDEADSSRFFADREVRAPRLRFQKREAKLPVATNVETHSRKRRSATVPLSILEKELGTARHKRWSINNDLQAIADMVYHEKYLQRQREIQNLIDLLNEAGKKRSAPIASAPSESSSKGEDNSIVSSDPTMDSLRSLLGL